MSRRIKVTVGGVEVDGELNETRTADLIWDSLPFESPVNTWEMKSISPFQSRPNWTIRHGRLWISGIWGIGHPAEHSAFFSAPRQTAEGMRSGRPAR